VIPIDLADALTAAAYADRLLLASDFDGTLSPLAPHPEDAQPEEGAIEALTAAASLPGVDVIIISGRAEDVLATLTGRPEGVTLIGTHGAMADYDPRRRDLVGEAAALTRALRAVEDEYPGTVVEAKPVGAALHYRHADDPMAAAHAASEVGHRFDARIVTGKQVVELVLSEGDKGTSLLDRKRALSADVIVFFGDDVTDEDVVTSLSGEDIGIKVGPEPSDARYRVDDPAAVVEAIEHLVAERRRVS
jgi:trehalose 6-phosphate phosphatase